MKIGEHILVKLVYIEKDLNIEKSSSDVSFSDLDKLTTTNAVHVRALSLEDRKIIKKIIYRKRQDFKDFPQKILKNFKSFIVEVYYQDLFKFKTNSIWEILWSSL